MTLSPKLTVAVAAAVLAMPTAVHAALVADGSLGDSTTLVLRGEVLPYAGVQLDAVQMVIRMPAWCGDSRAIFVGGTVTTNFPVALGVSITPPPNAPRSTEWEVRALVDHIDRPGVHRFDRLLRIQAFKKGPPWDVAQRYTLNLFAATADAGPVQRRARARGSASSADLSYGGGWPGYGRGGGHGARHRGGGGSKGHGNPGSAWPTPHWGWGHGSFPGYGWPCRPPLKPDPGPPGTVTLLVMPRP